MNLINIASLIAHKMRFSFNVSDQVRHLTSLEVKGDVSDTIYYQVWFIHDIVDIARDTVFDELEKL